MDHEPGFHFAINIDIAMFQTYLANKTGDGWNTLIQPTAQFDGQLSFSLDFPRLVSLGSNEQVSGAAVDPLVPGSNVASMPKIDRAAASPALRTCPTQISPLPKHPRTQRPPSSFC